MKEKIAELLSSHITSMSSEEIIPLLEVPPKQDMGDFAFPCFRLAKEMRKAPPVIAAELAESLGNEAFLKKVVAAGPYLNFYIDPEVYAKEIVRRYEERDEKIFGIDGKGKTVCIDYSSPNVAKNFHVGHLRTTIIGNSLYKILERLGYHVERINHLGDWGTQFGKLAVAYRKWGSREAVEEKGIQELMDIYVKFHEEAEKDPSLEDEARAAFAAMENGDKEALEIWEWFRDISLKEFIRVYDILGMSFDHYTGESFYIDKTEPVMKVLNEKKLLVESDGALVVRLDEYDMPPCIVAKSDGSSIYATRDLAAVYYRKATFNFDKALYVTGLEQKLHFAQVFKVIELMGNDYAKDLIHIPYGLVSLKSGKISSRKGNVIFAEDILNEAIQKTKNIIEEKNPDVEGKDETARKVGVGAIIFNDLYNQRIKDVIFDWDKILNFDGETGPYVQYTYARSSSVLRKVGDYKYGVNPALASDEYSVALLKIIDEYPEAVKEAARRYEPSVVARYAMELAHAFNVFYRECQINVEDQALRDTRASIVSMARETIKDALSLLGIESPEQM